MPFIYAKICPSAVVLVDTGCGGAARDPSVQLTSLREFLETYPVEDNGGQPLNPEGSDLRAYASTLSRLRGLVRGWNGEEEGEGRAGRRRRVKMACGHVTSAADAEEFVGEVEAFLDRVRRGLVAPQDRGEARGFPLVGFEREDGRISFQGPKKLFDDFCTREGGV